MNIENKRIYRFSTIFLVFVFFCQIACPVTYGNKSVACLSPKTFLLPGSIPEPSENNSNPYLKEENVSRTFDAEMDSAYGLTSDLIKRADIPQRMLLVGVGRGMTAIEYALKFPRLEIVAINKEEDLWSDQKIREKMMQRGYSLSEINSARKRITVLALDIENQNERAEKIGKTPFDLVFFEPRVQTYFEGKKEAIEDIFNEYVKQDGLYGFVVNSIYTSEQALEDSPFLNGMYERNPDGKAVRLIAKAFNAFGCIVRRSKLGGNLYLKVHRINKGDVKIPLENRRSKLVTIPSGLTLAYSVYDEAYKGYGSIFQRFEEDLAEVIPQNKNKTFLIDGDPGSGKTTMMPEFKSYLTNRGYQVATIDSNKFFNLNLLLTKQIFLISLFKYIPDWLVPLPLKMRLYRSLLSDSEKIKKFVETITNFWGDETKEEIEITIENHEPIRITRNSILVFEGCLAEVFFRDIRFDRRLYLKIGSQLQKERIFNRSRKKGASFPKALLHTKILSSKTFSSIFRDNIGDYDYHIDISQEDNFTLTVMNKLMASPNMVEKVVSEKDVTQQEINILQSEYQSIDMTHDEIGRFASAASEVLKDLAVKKGHKITDLKICIGYDENEKASGDAEFFAQVLTSYGYKVDFIDEPVLTPSIADKTIGKDGFDIAFYITASHKHIDFEPLRDSFYQKIKLFQSGVRASDSFSTEIKNQANLPDIVDGCYRYTCYEFFDKIPRDLIRKIKIVDQDKEKFAFIFSVDELRQKIPSFIEAMKKRGYNLSKRFLYYTGHEGNSNEVASLIDDRLDIVSEYLAREPLKRPIDTDELKVGDLSKGIHLHQTLPSQVSRLSAGYLGFAADQYGDRLSIRDINGAEITPNDLALIFLHYLGSRGEKGEVIKTLPVGNAIDRLAEQLGLKINVSGVGTPNLNSTVSEDTLLSINSSGHLFFKFKGEVFRDNALAQALLALQIMINSKMTLSEYLKSIYEEIGNSFWARSSISANTYGNFSEIENTHLMLREDPEEYLSNLFPYLDGSLRNSWFNLDIRDKKGIKITFKKNDGSLPSWVFIRSSTTEKIIRVYAEASSIEEREALISAAKQMLIDLSQKKRLNYDRVMYLLQQFAEQTGEEIEFNKKIKSTIKLNGIAWAYYEPEGKELLQKMVRFAKEHNIPFYFTGGGANTVFAAEIPGLVISMKKMKKIEISETEIVVGAGKTLKELSRVLRENNLFGLEFASGIYGQVGGAVVMNSGYRFPKLETVLTEEGFDLNQINFSMSDVVKEVHVVTLDGEFKVFTHDDMKYDHRYSILQDRPAIVYQAVLHNLRKDDNPERINTLLEIMSDLRTVWLSRNAYSVGCTFCNRHRSYNYRGKNYTAGELINQWMNNLNLKEFEWGEFYMTPNFSAAIYNKGNGSLKDYADLIKTIYDWVYQEYGIRLILEVKAIPGFEQIPEFSFYSKSKMNVMDVSLDKTLEVAA